MENTANLALPYILPSQAQKHVTHNEALVLLDAIIQLAVVSRAVAAPPDDAPDGKRYIVPPAASGDWAGWQDAVALRLDGGWHRVDPQTGWFAWIGEEGSFVVWDGEMWRDLGDGIPRLQNLDGLGIGTAADAVNPFAAKLNKALWTARYVEEGGDGDLRYTLNKQAPAGVASLLMQSDWSGRAEIGLIGDNDLTIKVSPDGDDWKEALRIDTATGAVSFPNSATMLDVLGSGTQAGGTPTGALIAKGANANGSYVRFADGTQICRHRMTPAIAIDVAFAGGYRSEAIGWTFPAPFVAGSRDDIIICGSAGLVSHGVQAQAASHIAADWYHLQPAPGGVAERPAALVAFGRWS